MAGQDASAAAVFDPLRPKLTRVAYRMLGSAADAEDVVQEAFLRWREVDMGEVLQPEAFLRRVVTRLALDVLKSAKRRREVYVGPWLPEPVLEPEDAEEVDDVTLPLMLALERLSPLERAAFLLHDVFDYSFAQVAATLDRNEAACRQLASRARTRVREARPAGPAQTPRDQVDPKHAALLSAFLTASRSGDLDGLTKLLTADARLVADGGGKAQAALNVLEGAHRVAAFLAGAVKKGWTSDLRVELGTINGLPGAIISGPQGVVQTTAVELEGDLVKAIYVVRNPDKLKHITSH
jgi:RNA polymerase sigma-70 factor (ECF subfamily)